MLSNRGWDYWGYGKANNKPSQNHQPYEVEFWDILRFLSLGLDTIGFTIGLFFQAPVGCLRMLMDLRHVPWRWSLGHQARAFSLTSSSCVNVIIKPHWGNTWETVWYNYIYTLYIYIYIIYILYIYYYIILYYIYIYITTYIYILYMGNLGSYFGVIRKSTTCSTTTVVAQCLPPICLFGWMASNFACKLFSACHNLWRYSWMVYSGKTYFFNMDDVGDPYFRKPPFCWRRLHQAIKSFHFFSAQFSDWIVVKHFNNCHPLQGLVGTSHVFHGKISPKKMVKWIWISKLHIKEYQTKWWYFNCHVGLSSSGSNSAILPAAASWARFAAVVSLLGNGKVISFVQKYGTPFFNFCWWP